MDLDSGTCIERLQAADHGVLATLHAVRGVDAVPVVFAMQSRRILIPVDTVKPKRSTALQRIRNLEADPRCALLVEHYSADWDQLWWVRAHGRAEIRDVNPSVLEALAFRHPRYRVAGSIVSVVTLTLESVTGWTAR
jgi:PPOX class probable F420-dependent enzyme